MERYEEIERSIIKTYRKKIWNNFIKGIRDYKLIQENDKIAVCISGGKDSMLLAKLMQQLQKHGETNFELEFIVMDPGYNEENRQKIIDNSRILNIPIKIFESDIFHVVTKTDESPCYLCARMRRGHLYSMAKELGCNKIALGHHFNDVIETVLMGMIYGGQIQTMMPKLHSTNFEGMELIRPMYCVPEDAIIAWRNYNKLEFLQCACRFTENIEKSEDKVGASKRQEIKMLIKEIKKDCGQIDKNIFKSIHNINLNTIIGYSKNGEEHNFLDYYDVKEH